MFKPCIVIPTYNNRGTLPGLLDALEGLDSPRLVVDDGSDEATRSLLAAEAARRAAVRLRRRDRNGGKGAAVKTGLLWAEELGFTHALQIDADGQHEIGDIPAFLAAARGQPEALVLGKPTFGADVPKARLYGRQLSRYLVFLETLSLAIGDPLFGFRVYPLAAAAALIRRVKLGDRMDFDPEIAVRLHWDGVPIHNIETRVIYPEGGVSHFQMVRDNVRLAWLHARLVAGMLLRAPRLLVRGGAS